MIRPGFLSPPERRELVACVRSQREDHGVARRANTMLLLDDGKSCQAIGLHQMLCSTNYSKVEFSANICLWLASLMTL